MDVLATGRHVVYGLDDDWLNVAGRVSESVNTGEIAAGLVVVFAAGAVFAMIIKVAIQEGGDDVDDDDGPCVD